MGKKLLKALCEMTEKFSSGVAALQQRIPKNIFIDPSI